MSAVAAVPAAVRLPHSAAARRALLTLLFLGGFLALAVVLGGSAQAASETEHEGGGTTGAAGDLLKSDKPSGLVTDSVTDSARGSSGKAGPAGKLTSGLTKAEREEQQLREAQRAGERSATQLVGPVAEGVDRTEAVTRPVGELVDGVVDSPGGLREVTGRLGLGELAGDIPGNGSGDGGGRAPAGGTDCPSDSTNGDKPGDRANGPRANGARGTAPAAPVPGTANQTAAGDGVSGGEGAPADRLPCHRTPATLAPSASQYAGESQGHHAGPHQLAAVLADTEHVGPLQPGAARAADRTPTRERTGDVFGFPG